MVATILKGVPGAGKSYTVVSDDILPALQRGRRVITNVPLRMENLRKFYPDADDLVIHRKTFDIRFFGRYDLELDEFLDVSDDLKWRHPEIHGMGPLVVIDEAHKYFQSRNCPQDIINWFGEHRRLGAEVILLTQRFADIPKPLRDRCEFTVYIDRNPIVKLMKPQYWLKPVYMRKYYRTEDLRNQLEVQIRTYDPLVFSLYESHRAGAGAYQDKKRPTGLRALRMPLLLGGGCLSLFLLTQCGSETEQPAVTEAVTDVPLQSMVQSSEPAAPVLRSSDAANTYRQRLEEAVLANAVALAETGQTLPPPTPNLSPAVGPLAGWRLWLKVSAEIDGRPYGTVCGLRSGNRACWSLDELRDAGYIVHRGIGGGDLLLEHDGERFPLRFRHHAPIEPPQMRYPVPGWQIQQAADRGKEIKVGF